MKKNTKKQANKRIKKTLKTKGEALNKAKKKISRKIAAKPATKLTKKKTHSSVTTKTALKKNVRVVLKQKAKKNVQKVAKRARKQNGHILTFGDIQPQQGKLLLLVIAIVFACSILIVQSMTKEEKMDQPQISGVESNRNILREKEIHDLVAGYPIEKMTRFIAKQDPKVAAFLVAIAKKESAWGDRKPVLNGEDCYNYWGFRLKSDRMGSGGHTCFDSPEEAVEIVGSRISHLVNEEKIDTPKKMVVWKCGYGCDGPEAAGSEKWIKDVDYYYKQMIN